MYYCAEIDLYTMRNFEKYEYKAYKNSFSQHLSPCCLALWERVLPCKSHSFCQHSMQLVFYGIMKWENSSNSWVSQLMVNSIVFHYHRTPFHKLDKKWHLSVPLNLKLLKVVTTILLTAFEVPNFFCWWWKCVSWLYPLLFGF